MDVTYIFDSPVYFDSIDSRIQIYGNNKNPASRWVRYLTHFDSIYAVLRGIKTTNSDKERLKEYNIDNVIYNLYPGFSSIKNLRKSIKHIKNSVITSEVLIIRMPSISGIIACHYAKKFKMPYAVEVVANIKETLSNQDSFFRKILAIPLDLLSKKYIKIANFSLFVTKEYLQKVYPSNGVVDYASNVDLGYIDFDQIKSKRILKIQRFSNSNKIYIGMIGAIGVPYKGHKTALRAVKLLMNEHNVVLRILGKGNKNILNNEIRKLGIFNNVIFDGVLPGGEDVFDWLDNIDIFIMPSYTEGLPRALIEALSRGCPSVGTMVGGIPELLNSNYMIQPNDHKALSSKIKDFIENPDKMISQALINLEKSKEYSQVNLDKKRYDFWKNYKEFVKKKDEFKHEKK